MAHAYDPDLEDHDGELPPDTFLIAHDDYHAKHVGTTADGRQFFITTPFTSDQEYVARYLFDTDGDLLDAEIAQIGGRPDPTILPGNVMTFAAQEQAISHMLEALGPVTFGDITIAPFTVTAHGQEFGMVLNGPHEDDPDEEWYWSVTLEPGDFMSFSAPWDSGDYDT